MVEIFKHILLIYIFNVVESIQFYLYQFLLNAFPIKETFLSIFLLPHLTNQVRNQSLILL